MSEEKSISPEKIEKNLIKRPDQDFDIPGSNTEKILTPEQKPEQVSDLENSGLDEKNSSSELVSPVMPVQSPSPQRLKEEKKVENILERDLKDIYQQLPDNKKQEFRLKGEETSKKIVDLLEKGKAKARDVMKLIINWLKVIPGVNRFFIEQEAKIKTDEIISLKKKINN